ncbi:WhiB family transcriptional regulator [Actinokineospora iranica]|uniref:Transcription factor WhiB n=1 Tax=Actinokineospora iranica TaxID=1271860 RepID=A0A1G6Y7E1_9PSEU|nr:WhiB family transcriptional regulator [Actinokineospora iranica]SDD86318.1 Transcription factor WhiB [Actinokineospora iranica]
MTLRLPEWHARAACRGRIDLDFVEPGEQLAECLALCAACPVAEQCLAEALDAGEAWGIRGGLDADQREKLAEQTGHPAPVIKPAHGTNSRYAKHGCRCDLCREAHTAYDRQRRERNRARARAGDPWVRPIALAAPMRTGRRWTGAGQYVLPLPGVPAPDQVEAGSGLVELVAVAA